MKILVYDHGLCTEAAIKLKLAGHSVAYFAPWQADFPEMNSVIGRDLDGLDRVENFSAALDRSDLVVCFDTFSEDREQQARKSGKLVWGAGGAEKLELDRVYMKQLQEKLKLPTQPWQTIQGINSLITYLKTAKKKWIKATGKHRGLIETFFHDSWNLSRSMELGQMMSDFGPIGDSIEFLIEDPIGKCEPGFDGIFVRGEYLSPHIIGYEDKDETYIGHITSIFPSPIHPVTKAILPILKSYASTTLVSFEVRVDENQKGYLIDPCLRAPHPPLACELEAFSNFADIITEGARGNALAVKTPCKYTAAIEIKSDWVKEHWCHLEFPKKNRQWVKLQKACMVDGEYWALPGSFVVATCVGIGDTVKTACDQAMKVAAEFKCKGMYYDEASLDNLQKKTIPEGIKYGINF